MNGFLSGIGIVDTGHESKVTHIFLLHELAQVRQGVDVFAYWREFEYPLAIALFHMAVVFEKGNIVSGAFHTGDQTRFVMEFDARSPHMVADTRTLDAGGKIVSDFILVSGGESTSEKGGNMLGFDSVHSGTHDVPAEGLEGSLTTKNHVSSIFHLHEAPVIAGVKVT